MIAASHAWNAMSVSAVHSARVAPTETSEQLPCTWVEQADAAAPRAFVGRRWPPQAC